MMSLQLVPLPLQWTVLQLTSDSENDFSNRLVKAANIERRLARILGEWELTPYDTKFADKGIGSSCAGFVCRVLDELYGQSKTDLPSIPTDISFHSPSGALASLKWFMRAFPQAKRIKDGWVQPGDVIITKPTHGGPGHAMIVGPRENTLWQNIKGGVGVHFTGLYVSASEELHSVFRFTDREKWA